MTLYHKLVEVNILYIFVFLGFELYTDNYYHTNLLLLNEIIDEIRSHQYFFHYYHLFDIFICLHVVDRELLYDLYRLHLIFQIDHHNVSKTAISLFLSNLE